MPEKQTSSRLTLQNLLKSRTEIWVKNNSAEASQGYRYNKPGPVTMQIGEGEGRRALIVPVGPDPVCLTDKAPHRLLQNCTDLFLLTDNGFLTLMDPKHARDYYRKNKERQRVVQDKISRIERNIADSPKGKQEDDARKPQVDGTVLNLALQINGETIAVKEAVEKVEIIRHTAKYEDLTYLYNNVKDPSFKEYLAGVLKERRAEES